MGLKESTGACSMLRVLGASLSVCLMLMGALAADDEVVFLRGDTNGDGVVSISDSHFLLSWLFRGNVAPSCLSTADLNLDDRVNITDFIYGLDYLFMGGTAPPAPFPDAGEDPTADSMSCWHR